MMKEVLKYPYEASIGVLYPFGGFFNALTQSQTYLERRNRFGDSENKIMVMLVRE